MSEKDRLDLFRKAMRETVGDPVLDRLAAQSMLAALPPDAPEHEIFLEETAPKEAHLTLHIEGENVKNHAAPAKPISVLIDKIVQTSKALALSSLDKNSRAGSRIKNDEFLVHALEPGSLVITISAPEHEDLPSHTVEGQQEIQELQEIETIQSQSLRSLAALLGEVNEIIQASEVEQIDRVRDAAKDIPANAVPSLRTLTEVISKQAWELKGMVRQYRKPVKRIKFTTFAAQSLNQVLNEREEEPKIETFDCTIDGFKNSTGDVFLKMLGNHKSYSYRILESDAELFLLVRELATNPDTICRARVEHTTSRILEGQEAATVKRRLLDIYEVPGSEIEPLPLE